MVVLLDPPETAAPVVVEVVVVVDPPLAGAVVVVVAGTVVVVVDALPDEPNGSGIVVELDDEPGEAEEAEEATTPAPAVAGRVQVTRCSTVSTEGSRWASARVDPVAVTSQLAPPPWRSVTFTP